MTFRMEVSREASQWQQTRGRRCNHKTRCLCTHPFNPDAVCRRVAVNEVLTPPQESSRCVEAARTQSAKRASEHVQYSSCRRTCIFRAHLWRHAIETSLPGECTRNEAICDAKTLTHHIAVAHNEWNSMNATAKGTDPGGSSRSSLRPSTLKNQNYVANPLTTERSKFTHAEESSSAHRGVAASSSPCSCLCAIRAASLSGNCASDKWRHHLQAQSSLPTRALHSGRGGAAPKK